MVFVAGFYSEEEAFLFGWIGYEMRAEVVVEFTIGRFSSCVEWRGEVWFIAPKEGDGA